MLRYAVRGSAPAAPPPPDPASHPPASALDVEGPVGKGTVRHDSPLA